jgi:hypothetical protein
MTNQEFVFRRYEQHSEWNLTPVFPNAIPDSVGQTISFCQANTISFRDGRRLLATRHAKRS